MQIIQIPLDQLTVSKANVRKRQSAKIGLDALKNSIAARGLRNPLIVEPEGEGYAVCAGQRRLMALQALKGEAGEVDPVPCQLKGQETAQEASLDENITQQPMDQLEQCDAFLALIKQGLSEGQVAKHYAVTEHTVKQRLQLANAVPAARKAFLAEQLSEGALKLLAAVSPKRQRQILKDYLDEGDFLSHHVMKQIVGGGQQVPVKHALFDVAESGLDVVTDLFDDEGGFFADSAEFWVHQEAAIEAREAKYKSNKWKVERFDERVDGYYPRWSMVGTSKKKGGMIAVEIRTNGEVTFHEGVALSDAYRNTADKRKKPPARQITKRLEAETNAWRCHKVRRALVDHPDLVLRLLVVGLASNHYNFGLELDNASGYPQGDGELAVSGMEAELSEQVTKLVEALGFQSEGGSAFPGPLRTHNSHPIGLMGALADHDNDSLIGLLATLVGAGLRPGSGLVEALGEQLHLSLAEDWRLTPAFLKKIRSRAALTALLADLTDRDPATVLEENQKTKLADLRAVVEKAYEPEAGWLPPWLQFPVSSYPDAGEGTDAEKALQHVRKTLSD